MMGLRAMTDVVGELFDKDPVRQKVQEKKVTEDAAPKPRPCPTLTMLLFSRAEGCWWPHAAGHRQYSSGLGPRELGE
jgi:hypothetical protein